MVLDPEGAARGVRHRDDHYCDTPYFLAYELLEVPLQGKEKPGKGLIYYIIVQIHVIKQQLLMKIVTLKIIFIILQMNLMNV